MVTKIFAHRGSKGTAPENTLASFKHALEVQSDGIELDVHLSADGIPIVIHDETINRTTDGTGWVKDLTVEELQQVDAGSWYSPAFEGEKIPTLEEVLLFLSSHDFQGALNIELKTDEIPYPGIEKTVWQMVKKHQPVFSIVYSSFNYETIERLLEVDESVEFALLFNKRGLNINQLPSGKKVHFWHPHRKLVPLLLKNQMRLPLRVWTVNRTWEMRYFFKQNVDTIMTDFPEKALRVRKMLQGE